MATNREGEVHGRLTVLGPAPGAARRWRCRCACGREVVIHATNLGRRTWSCGCLRLERVTTHGLSRVGQIAPEYYIWQAMHGRCRNPNTKQWKDYGGRGITVCQRWGRFENFLADMGRRPAPHLTLERVDNDAGYSPSNCKWATRKEQSANRRMSKMTR